jgi:hypothetical protein
MQNLAPLLEGCGATLFKGLLDDQAAISRAVRGCVGLVVDLNSGLQRNSGVDEAQRTRSGLIRIIDMGKAMS